MKRAAIYSSTRRPARTVPDAEPAARQTVRDEPVGTAVVPTWRGRTRAFIRSRAPWMLVLVGALFALALILPHGVMNPAPRALTQEDIDAAVLHTMENKRLPSRAAKAAEAVRPSVVLVRGYVDDGEDGEREYGVGSGVVIVDEGIILTNLHVVQNAKRMTVTFSDGLESEAVLVGVRPETDLAVVRAKTIPDDLAAATLGSTQTLRPGDEVVAVGFPFGIGPSVTMGVISGLNREFHSPEGDRRLSRLIQFDAAANSGSSGGPLVTMDGEVIGIVTAILNPTKAGTFIGIGFAVTIEAAGSAVGIPPF